MLAASAHTHTFAMGANTFKSGVTFSLLFLLKSNSKSD
jgi:hypothetical protein